MKPVEIYAIPETNAVVLKQETGEIIAPEDWALDLLKQGVKLTLRGVL